MKNIEVLGSGCAKCVLTADLIQKVAQDSGAQVNVIKQTSPEIMLKYGVMRTPAVVIDGKLTHSGSVPNRALVETWLK